MVAISATAGGEVNAFALPVPLAEVSHTEVPLADDLPPYPQQAPDSSSCSLHYAAVLDLAELAHQYGKSSGAYRHAFGSMTNQLDACRPDARYAAASSGPADAPRAGAAVSSYD